MGRLDAIVDMTGQSNQLDINSQNIENIIDELNRNSDQLDAIANSLNIIGRGSQSGTWNGVGGINSGLIIPVNHGFQTAPLFLAYYTRSDIANQVFPVPNWEFDNSGSLLGRVYAYSSASNLVFTFARTNNGSPIVVTFSWYVIQQPAQVPTGS